MRKDFAKAASKGTVIKNQNFMTARGVYQIVFVRYENDIYFFKHRNGKLVECCNLSSLGNNQDKASMQSGGSFGDLPLQSKRSTTDKTFEEFKQSTISEI